MRIWSVSCGTLVRFDGVLTELAGNFGSKDISQMLIGIHANENWRTNACVNLLAMKPGSNAMKQSSFCEFTQFKQVAHSECARWMNYDRLVTKRKFLIIDDAFNSWPTSSCVLLELPWSPEQIWMIRYPVKFMRT